jgi:hypothetical protein
MRMARGSSVRRRRPIYNPCTRGGWSLLYVWFVRAGMDTGRMGARTLTRLGLRHLAEQLTIMDPDCLYRVYRDGRVATACRITASICSRSSPSTGRRGARVVSLPRPASAMASLMYCTSLILVSRWSRGVYQR